MSRGPWGSPDEKGSGIGCIRIRHGSPTYNQRHTLALYQQLPPQGAGRNQDSRPMPLRAQRLAAACVPGMAQNSEVKSRRQVFAEPKLGKGQGRRREGGV